MNIDGKLSNRDLISFVELERALNELPDQTNGIPCSISDIGESYVEFRARAIARPGDEKIVERLVVAEMCEKLDDYFKNRTGRIYWRFRFEFEIAPHSVVVRLDINGPDVDFITNKKCVMDKNWLKVTAYCRLVRTRMPIPALTPILEERKVA